MVEHARIEHLDRYVDREVEIKGWIYNTRSSGKINFTLVRDGSGILQCISEKGEVEPDVFEKAESLPQETSVIIRGRVKEDERAPGGYELQLSDLEVVQEPSEQYPITLKEHGVDFLMNHRHLWLRSEKQNAQLRVRSHLIQSIRTFFNERDFVMMDAPIITPAACEGTTTLFEVDYFGESAYLSQSGQLYGEAGAMAFGKCYVFGPTFRAEKSDTRRHLTEFWMVEPEVAYADLEDVMELSEEFLTSIIHETLDNSQDELERLDRDTERLRKVEPPFPRISYTDAVEWLRDEGYDMEWGDDFGSPEETALSERYEKPVMIHRFPMDSKAFYMKPDPENPDVALCVDVIAPEGVGEIIGGGQREDELEALEKQIKAHDLPEDVFDWYLDLRRFGSVPHGGFGLGLERMIAWLCGTHHVRETIPFPRQLNRKYP